MKKKKKEKEKKSTDVFFRPNFNFDDTETIYIYSIAICGCLKLVSAIFYQIFTFSPNDSPLKTEKCFLFHLKSAFRSLDIQIFVIFSLSTLSRFNRANGNGIIYDVMI